MAQSKSKAKKPAAKKPAAKKSAADKAKATKARKEAAAKKTAERVAAQQQEREQAILDGKLVVASGGVEFHRVDRDGIGKIQARATAVLKELEGSKTPIVVRDVIAKHGGQFPQYLAMFQMLEAQGLVIPFRQRGGGRGEGASQVAYLWSENVS
jgi:hypothetical protein